MQDSQAKILNYPTFIQENGSRVGKYLKILLKVK